MEKMKKLCELIASKELRQCYSEKAELLVDGKGAERIADALRNLAKGNQTNIICWEKHNHQEMFEGVHIHGWSIGVLLSQIEVHHDIFRHVRRLVF